MFSDVLSREMDERLRAIQDLADRSVMQPPDDGVSVLAQTSTDGSYPVTAANVYVMLSGDLDGDETEGATATFVADGNKLYAYNCGSQIPNQGTYHIVTSDGGRWVFRADSTT